LDRFLSDLKRTKTITFDCYGTLIDWEQGLRQAFDDVFGQAAKPHFNALFDAYLKKEMEIQGGAFRPYRSIVAEAVTSVAERFGLTCTTKQSAALADSVGDWEPFVDTNSALAALKIRYKLGILSNVDRDLFARTAAKLSVCMDVVITAQDVQSYKPAPGHFLRLLDEYSGPGEALHVAQSLYHDGVPAEQLGIPFVWINRRGEKNLSPVRPLAQFPDLASFAQAVCDRG